VKERADISESNEWESRAEGEEEACFWLAVWCSSQLTAAVRSLESSSALGWFAIQTLRASSKKG